MTVIKAIIPAAGMGTRFLPVTKAQPKEMLPVVDKPIMQYVIEEATDAGATQILLVTGRGKRVLEDHFDRSVELEQILELSADAGSATAAEKLDLVRSIAHMAQLFYVRQKTPKGLGHAIACGAPFTADQAFYVALGDVIVPDHGILPRLAAVHAETGASVIAVERVPRVLVSRYGIIGGLRVPNRDGVWRVDELVEKPDPADAPGDLAIIGRYLLTPRVMELLADTAPGAGGEIQLTDALVALLEHEELYAVEVPARSAFDTGNVLAWLEANIQLALRDERYADELRELLKGLI
ncbi:MAG: UTP--glucose-1-phosphate uridylyltransferase [Actinomycetes bacterium]|jgi:UTP--glucose-1-phosphate uridylyltransferase|nr:UTP--glucose-1-phosphate uridylyltransferase [Actinomycetes bacterium]